MIPPGVLSVLAAAAAIPVYYRWLRVAQREHYLAGRVSFIAILWIKARPVNLILWAVAAGFVGASARWPDLAVPGLLIIVIWPVGMSVRPTSRKLRFTPRLVRLTVAVTAGIAAATVGLGPTGGLIVVVTGPMVVDLALLLLRPLEAVLGRRFVGTAQAKLARLRPLTIGITGSYGKTSTKQYAAHLIGGFRATFATPASFNNLMGLSRSINEHMAPGTEVFIAEMGTYRPGEIRQLCDHFPPAVAAIVTIGEAHLERMRSRSEIVRAKVEIVERAGTVVLNIDDPDLSRLADRLSADKRVVRCSASATAAPSVDIAVYRADAATAIATVNGSPLASFAIPATTHEINVAIAAGLAYAVGVPARQIAAGLASLPDVEHRALVQPSSTGVIVIDDTYNSNPTGAERAVTAAAALRADGRAHLWVVTPGMVELGRVQPHRNRALAGLVAAAPRSTLAVVGRTNRPALIDGGTAGGADVVCFDSRDRAARAVFDRARPGDVVLFENDLPDHYP